MKRLNLMPLAVAGALAASALAPSRPAAAASFDDSIVAAKQAVYALFSGMLSPFRGDTVEAPTPISPTSLIHGIESKTGSHFWQHLSDAGYELVAIDTSVGIIPDVKLTFQIVRELSEADRNALERKLDIDEIKDPGMVQGIQRQIVRTLLEVSDVSDMRVGKLTIGILPLPSADFEIEPREVPMSEDHDALLRAIHNKAKATRVDPHKAQNGGGAPSAPGAASEPTD